MEIATLFDMVHFLNFKKIIELIEINYELLLVK